MTEPHRSETFVVASNVEPVLKSALDASATVRAQFERIASVSGVRVFITFALALPEDRLAKTEFRSSAGRFEARVEISTPLRAHEYAEWLAHEFEHVLEQLEGLDLVSLARSGDRGVVRLADGSYETSRAIGAGRRASQEVFAAGR